MFLSFALIFGHPKQAQAWGLSDIVLSVTSFFGSANAEEKEELIDATSQTASLLRAAPPVLESENGNIESIVEDSALKSEAGPLGTAADFEYLPQTSSKIETYIVKKGDSLSVIASKYNVSVDTVVWANNLGNTHLIKEGQVLVILPISGVKHKIKAGDTLQSIAKLYGGSVEDIEIYNDIEDSSKIKIGDTVIIPGGEIRGVAPTTAVATAPKKSKLPYYSDYFMKPIADGRRTQGLHGFNAVDLASRTKQLAGTEPILASATGEVLIARYSGWNGGYGKYIVISHPNGTQTLYAHCFSILVNEGQHVDKGQIIGFVGNTGKSTGTHLHFEIRGAQNPF